MHIGVHAVPAFKENPTGVEVYAREVIMRMLRILRDERSDEDIKMTLYTNEKPAQPIAEATIKVLKSPILWTQVRLGAEMAISAPDVLFVPANALPRQLPRRSVLTIHGLEFMQSPQHYSFKQRHYLNVLTRDAIKRASHLITVSHASAAALEEYFGVPYDRLTVIPHGSSKMPVDTIAEERKQPYFLYVGRLETHKNIIGLVRAFTMFRQRHAGDEYELLLAGKPGFGHERIKKAIAQSSSQTAIVELGYVSEKRKWSLLKEAAAFCFPSYSEGFGLPILEAQAAGIPVVTSNVTAMPEIASSTGAVLIDPNNTEKIAEAMERVVSDTAFAKMLVAHGRENVARFSWDKTARATLNIILENTA